MPEVVGRLITCERCGNQTFIAVSESGYCILPIGWRAKGPQNENLCPDCAEKWERVTDDFFHFCGNCNWVNKSPHEEPCKDCFRKTSMVKDCWESGFAADKIRN